MVLGKRGWGGLSAARAFCGSGEQLLPGARRLAPERDCCGLSPLTYSGQVLIHSRVSSSTCLCLSLRIDRKSMKCTSCCLGKKKKKKPCKTFK